MGFEYRKLRGRIKEKFNSESEFAKNVGLTKQSMSLKLTGKTSFSQEDINQWAKLLDIEPIDYGAYFFT